MRIAIRAADIRGVRRLQDALSAAGVEATAYVGAAAAYEREEILIVEKESDLGLSAGPGAIPSLATLQGRGWENPPSLGLEEKGPFQGALPLNAPPTLLARRVAAYVRAGASIEECARRRVTGSAFSAALAGTIERRSVRVLYIGAPNSCFLALERSLAAHNGQVFACFTSYIGIDHLHDDDFDAVVLNGASDPQMALTLCAALRRNASLTRLPTLVIVGAGADDVALAAIERGAAATVFTDASSCETALAWMFDEIRLERRRKSAEHDLHALRDLLGDPRTGLFLQQPFEFHLSSMANDHHASGRPMAFAALNVLPAHGAAEPSNQTWKKGFAEIASLASRLVRDSDCGCAYDERTIVVALPSTRLHGARRASERIARVAECTAFAAGESGTPPVVIEQSVVELQPGESGLALMARARVAIGPAPQRAKA